MIARQRSGNRALAKACYNNSVNPIDIWQAAQVLINQHGEKAESVAADNFVQFQKVGDADSAAIWTAIMIAIHQLAKPSSENG